MRRWQYLSKGWQNDGHLHRRTKSGFCTSCGAGPGESHYRLAPYTHDSEGSG